jgi:hypothetical protein
LEKNTNKKQRTATRFTLKLTQIRYIFWNKSKIDLVVTVSARETLHEENGRYKAGVLFVAERGQG